MEKGKQYLIIYLDDKRQSRSKVLTYNDSDSTHHIFKNHNKNNKEEGILKSSIIRWEQIPEGM